MKSQIYNQKIIERNFDKVQFVKIESLLSNCFEKKCGFKFLNSADVCTLLEKKYFREADGISCILLFLTLLIRPLVAEIWTPISRVLFSILKIKLFAPLTFFFNFKNNFLNGH